MKVVVWRVTQRCNLSCKFCGYDRELSWKRNEAAPERMRAFGAVLAEWARLNRQRVLVSWLGGEPLLWKPLAELTRIFRQEFDLEISATTNGTTLGCKTVRAHLIDHYSELTISVDAPGAQHDMLRGWPGGFEQLGVAVRALAREKGGAGRGPLLRGNVVLMHGTIAKFGALCHELAGWGIEEITFNQLGGNDRPEFYPANRLQSAQVAMFEEELCSLRPELGARGLRLRGGSDYLSRIAASSDGRRLPVEDCRIGEHFLFINEEGLAAPCSFTTEGYGVPIKEIDTVEKLNQLPGRFLMARNQRRLAACEDCHSTQMFDKFLL
ncbi:MAG: radical SAM protein [Verrucomicrobiota bacterium]